MSYTSVNNITGDLMRSKGATDSYRAGHERVFGERKIVEKEMFRIKVWVKQFGEPTKAEFEEYIATGKIKDRC
jgi:hypothetical protein